MFQIPFHHINLVFLGKFIYFIYQTRMLQLIGAGHCFEHFRKSNSFKSQNNPMGLLVYTVGP